MPRANRKIMIWNNYYCVISTFCLSSQKWKRTEMCLKGWSFQNADLIVPLKWPNPLSPEAKPCHLSTAHLSQDPACLQPLPHQPLSPRWACSCFPASARWFSVSSTWNACSLHVCSSLEPHSAQLSLSWSCPCIPRLYKSLPVQCFSWGLPTAPVWPGWMCLGAQCFSVLVYRPQLCSFTHQVKYFKVMALP